MRILLLLIFSLKAFGTEPLWLEGIAMEMPWRICIVNPKEKAASEKIIQSVFDEIYRTFSLFNPSSELVRLNNAPLQKTILLSADLYQLLKLSDEVHRLSGGRFDPTVGAVKKQWIASLAEKKTLSPQAVENLRSTIGMHNLSLSKGALVKKAPVSIDLDGCAKGFAVDRLVEALKQAGHTDLFVEWSGEMRALGQHPEGRPWTVLIPGKNNAPFPLTDLAIAGSGDYLQNWRGSGIEKEDVYCHIVEPKTAHLRAVGKGRVASSTVAARSCALADALATTCMLFDNRDELKKWIDSVQKQYPETLFWILHRESTP